MLEALRVGRAGALREAARDDTTDAELLERAAAPRCRTAVSFGYRALPAFARFRELLDADELHVVWTTGSRLRPGPPGWKDDPQQGGALSAYGVHALDYARWLLGEAEVEQATVAPNEDAFTAVLAHEGGRRTRLTVSLVADERVHRLEAGGSRAREPRRDRPRRRVHAHRRRPCGRRPGVAGFRPGPIRASAPFAVLALALLEDRERPTFTDGLQAQRLMDEVRRAAR